MTPILPALKSFLSREPNSPSLIAQTHEPERPNLQHQQQHPFYHLPFDVVENIFDHLDDPSVRQCALIARCFLEPARRRLFNSVTLSEDTKQEFTPLALFSYFRRDAKPPSMERLGQLCRNRQFEVFLTLSPDIGSYVRKLVIEDLHSNSPFSGLESRTDFPLATILPRLTDVASLSLINTYGLDDQCPYQLYKDFLETSKLSKVEIENVCYGQPHILSHFLTSIVLNKDTLMSLALTSRECRYRDMEMACDESDIRFPPQVNPINVLRSLQLKGPPQFVEAALMWILDPRSRIRLDKLTTLEVVCSYTSSIVQLISAALKLTHPKSSYRPTLTSLGITSGYLHSPDFLPSCPIYSTLCGLKIQHTLRSITFYPMASDMHYDDKMDSKSRVHDKLSRIPAHNIEWWCGVFEKCSFPNLEEFKVERRAGHAFKMLDGSRKNADYRRWRRFEAALLHATRRDPGGRSSCSFSINISSSLNNEYSDPSPEDWFDKKCKGSQSKRFLGKCFPQSHAEMISLQIDVTLHSVIYLDFERIDDMNARGQVAGEYRYTPKTRWKIVSTFVPGKGVSVNRGLLRSYELELPSQGEHTSDMKNR